VCSSDLLETDAYATRFRNHARSKGHNDSKRHKARVVGGEVSEALFETGLCLPSGTQMTERELDRVIKVIKDCCRAIKYHCSANFKNH
jgi:dTDP-4-amino-4,6-dideoxygalactose transaminase